MELVYILQIITILVSILTFVTNSFITLHTNKSKNVANIIAKQRLVFLQEYREYSSELLMLCQPFIVADKAKYNLNEIIHISFKLKSIIKSCYIEEKEIIDSLNKLLDVVINYSKDTDNIIHFEQLEKELINFEELINIYDLAYWLFIIDQSFGNRYKVDDFEKYYQISYKQFKEK